ncbi:MAG TPA: amidase, partial [Hyphomonadaceae bacterium]|nr:amidase [Hyphomonadaceae bacterium]
RLFGQTNNPYNLDVTPGGSSGGSAAALASGITPVEIGSDIGGSLRIPSHFTGVCALKPTFGLVSQHGHVPPSPEYAGEVDLNVVGPMARTVRDLKIMRSVIQAGATATQSGFALSLENKRLAVW